MSWWCAVAQYNCHNSTFGPQCDIFQLPDSFLTSFPGSCPAFKFITCITKKWWEAGTLVHVYICETIPEYTCICLNNLLNSLVFARWSWQQFCGTHRLLVTVMWDYVPCSFCMVKSWMDFRSKYFLQKVYRTFPTNAKACQTVWYAFRSPILQYTLVCMYLVFGFTHINLQQKTWWVHLWLW